MLKNLCDDFHMGHSSGLRAVITATPIKQKIPKTVNAHCVAIRSLVPGLGRPAGLPERLLGAVRGCAAISQNLSSAQALRRIVFNGVVDSAARHEFS